MRVKHFVRIVTVALFLAAVTSIHANPDLELIKTYYTGCDTLTQVGQSIWFCGGGFGSTGTLSGRWLQIDSTDCQNFETTTTYWEKCPNSSIYVQRDALGTCQCT
ncbi:MAG TPA: hypothetical protein VII75_09125 [Thermoanaerobaculia bacterium]